MGSEGMWNWRLAKGFLLFPTVERMAETPNGRKFTAGRRLGLHYFVLLLAHLLAWLPKAWTR